MNGKRAFGKVIVILLLLGLFAASTEIEPAYAGAPYPPELVSPANGATAGSNPPELCARNMGDPEGEQVYIKFEVWGGGDSDHQSDWITAGNPGDTVCWTDSGQWTAGTHSWGARTMANNEQSGGSPVWEVKIPAPPAPQPECTIDTLTTNPPGQAQAGTTVAIYASASCTNGVSSLRFKVDGSVIDTINAASGTVYWNTSGAAPTGHTITVEAADSVAGYIKTRSQNYDITAAAPPPTPDVNCAIDSLSIYPASPQSPGTAITISASASCNTGVRDMRIDITGPKGDHYSLGGSSSITWTWNTSGWPTGTYTITVEAAGQGDNNWSQSATKSKSFTLQAAVPTAVPVINSFSTGDVIQISSDVWVIVNGQRRLVPNPETLNALGIPRSWINNKGFSDTELKTIPEGADIPDAIREPSGFMAFKNAYFPNTTPIVPATATPVRTSGVGPTPTRTPTPRSQAQDMPTLPPETAPNGEETQGSQTCEVGAKAYLRPHWGLAHWFVLEIPKAVHEPYQIYFQGNLVPNNDNGVRHDGFQGETEMGFLLGISTKYALLHIFQGILSDSNWRIIYPCE